ncbi:LOW QUALITY PROTEIN: Hypothetical protein PHPALM_20124 [Phytophthora palmivora]|uniref:Uncharacterized protein n=1 Tax=Phytophthora palmivora TaxID=4796 RepID=A0A2P4XFN1_9STRA|nr:LOW QUALITY PROTEIN: Hypothetical protein PHPALM_20124 [Phytophthora palmivora]
MEALYERVLRLIPVDELREGYNDIVKEEISSINRAINDVSAAFAKLEEVRDAVNQLGSSSSASLMEVMDDTMTMQRELKRKLDRTITGMTGDRQKRKRENGTIDATSCDKGKNRANEEGESSILSTTPKQTVQILLRMDDETNRNRKSSKSEAWTVNLNKDNCMNELRKLTRFSVVERNRHVPDVLLQLADVIREMSTSDGIVILKYMHLWAHLSLDKKHLLEAFHNFCEMVSPWVNQVHHREAIGLIRLNKALLELVEQRRMLTTDESTQDIRLNYDLYIWHVNAMTPGERKKHVPRVISALRKEMSCGSCSSSQPIEVTKAMKLVVQWAVKDPQDPQLLPFYDDLVKDGKSFANGLSSFLVKTDLLGVLRKIEGTIRTVFKSTVEERTTDALNWARQLKEGGPVEDVDKGIVLLDEVIRHQQQGWKPRKNEDVHECYDILKEHALALEEGLIRGQRMTVIAKWKLNRFRGSLNAQPDSNVNYETATRMAKKRKIEDHDTDGTTRDDDSEQAGILSLASTFASVSSEYDMNPLEFEYRTTSGEHTNTTDHVMRDGSTSKPKPAFNMNTSNYFKLMKLVSGWDVPERSRCMPEVLFELAKTINQFSISELQQFGPKILKVVAVWALRCGTERRLVANFFKFAKAACKAVQKLPDNESVASRSWRGENHGDYDVLVWEADFMPPEGRRELVPHVIQALKTEMAQPNTSPDQPGGLLRAMNTIVRWVRQDLVHSKLKKLYWDLAQNVKLYANDVVNFIVKADLIRLANWTSRERAKQTLVFVNELTDTSPLESIDIAILMLDEVVRARLESQEEL